MFFLFLIKFLIAISWQFIIVMVMVGEFSREIIWGILFKGIGEGGGRCYLEGVVKESEMSLDCFVVVCLRV